jgi:hypothetical protein
VDIHCAIIAITQVLESNDPTLCSRLRFYRKSVVQTTFFTVISQIVKIEILRISEETGENITL